jgi:TonB-linked SusC/RagA family outer membrane protein
MSRSTLSRVVRSVGVAVVMLLSLTTVHAQQPTNVSVRVLETGTGRPIDQAQVAVAGTLIGGLTNAEGRVVIRGAPAGPQTIRVLRVGYAEAKQAINIRAGEENALEINLSRVAVDLSPVVVTATGSQLRREVGNTVATIDAVKQVELAPITTVADLLAARTSNLVVTTGTQTGSGSRTRIRGVASMSLSNEPIFVIDGIRMTSDVGSSSLFTGGAQPSRISDINPDEIESIEIVKGPSAAALYGTAAANGVVVIQTKRGRPGQARWTTYLEGGMLKDQNTYPTAYTLFGKATPTSTTQLGFNQCNLQRVGIGTCFVDSVAALNLFENDSLTPLGTGNRYQAGVQLTGGTDAVRYFLSGEREEEIGIMELPEFERSRLVREAAVLHDHLERPNALARNSVRANLNSAINQKLDFSLSSAWTNIDSRFSLESNATAGLGSQAFGGPGCIKCLPDRVVQAQAGQPALNTPLYGYRAWTPGYSWQERASQLVNRFLLSGTANYRPKSWWQVRGTVGDDFTDRIDDNLLMNGEGPPITATYRNGFKSNVRTDIRNTTVDLGSTMQYNFRPWLSFKTTGGAQYTASTFSQNQANGTELPPGAQTPNGAVTRTASQGTTLQRTIGFFVEEAASINDRLFLSAAVRTDQNSAFGTNYQRVYYPRASLAWVLSDEPFFPEFGFLNELRIRSAYGASGVQPGPNDALRFFGTSLQSIRATDQSGLQISALGNPELKPERSTEWESGFDAKMLDSRVNFELTYYNKRTKDALISAIVAPSAGSAGSVRRNIGAVGNQGWEFQVNTMLLDRAALGWDMTVSYSTNANKVISLGGTPEQKGTTNWVSEGYPINAFFENPILGYEDKNGDGLITYWGGADSAKNEIFVGDTDVFLGYNQPRFIGSLTTGFDLLNRKVRLQTLFDYRGGHKWYNNTERIRCTRPNCSGRMNPDGTLEEKAATTAALEHPARTNAGYFQDGEYVRWRELSLQYTMSESIASRFFRARGASVVGAIRNVKLWTAYRGVDPESDFTGASGDSPSEFQTLGPPSYFTIRFNFIF